MPRPLILADRGCPYAHRVLSLLDHLGVEHDLTEAPVGQLPAGLERWSASGRIPLLVHGALVVSESRVMLEHLAEAYGFESAYPRALRPRTEQRHAMALMDGTIAPRLARDGPPLGEGRLSECLDAFEAVARATPLEPCLFIFHFAPLWLRFQRWRPDGAITRAIRERPELTTWLDGAASLGSVVRTGPIRADAVAEFQAACAIHDGAGRVVAAPPG